MKIETLEVIRFSYTAHVAPDAGGHAHPAPGHPGTGALLRLSTDTGETGQVVVPPGSLEAPLVETWLRPAVIGAEPLRIAAVWQTLYHAQRGSGGRLTDRALAAVELAMWDLKGRILGQPVWKLLGGLRGRVPAYASTMCGDGIPGGLATPEDYARFAEWLVRERGYRGVKLHTWMPPLAGAPDVRRDAAACAAVREAVGPDVPLMLDPHHYYTRDEALWLGRQLEALDFLWMEEPMEEASISAYRWLNARLGRLAILGPETAPGKHWTRAEWVVQGACDMLRTGVWDVGGIGPSLKIAHLAESFHMACEVHGTGAGNLAVVAAIPNARFYERGLLHPHLDYEAPAQFQCRIDDEMDGDGYVHLRETPGLGQDLDVDFIEAHRL